MSKQNNKTSVIKGREITLTRIFDAPKELVFKAWTNEAMMSKWWGPKDFTVPYCKMDFRAGGKYLLCMRAPDGKDYWVTGVYVEITRPDRLVFTDDFADDKGNVVHGSFYGFKYEWPDERIVTVTFEQIGNKTKMTLHHTGLPVGSVGETEGWNQSFDKLAEILK